ncbi:MAG: hypothetical protein IT481_13755 [Gammaproteobacteria bacterium]|nr:hypothetical protein [Gammaproteobacteria bacterium]
MVARPFDPERLLRALARHRVDYVLIGAVAARLQGFPRMTADADITPADSASNLQRLAKALRELHARVYTESVPDGLEFDCSGASLGRAAIWNLVTDAGRVDVIHRPAGTAGYDDLLRSAVAFEAFGVTLVAASLPDILRSKRASGRPQDLADAEILEEMLRARL